ncbi:2743_t:CDS:2 [Ambispora leptoticha]|uniref:2743_t:CDS:1 n=1 Tax=Ambispora leptoticha TaxID=144679 RepID=A0A9N9D381_9GLOM|nr:2743_t:CDS:2 [Ambispora leptoticha]
MAAQSQVNPVATEKLSHDAFIDSPTINKPKILNEKIENQWTPNVDTYIKDLRIIPEHKFTVTTLFPPLTYVVYFHRAIRDLVLTVLFNWSMPFLHPLNFLVMVTVFPAIVIVLVVLEAVLRISYSLGFGYVLKGISKKWGDGLSPVNWSNPTIFSDDKVNKIVKVGIARLARPLAPAVETVAETTNRGTTNVKQTREFNLDIAETLLLMSAIIYERDDLKVHEARKLALERDTIKRDDAIYNKLRDSEKRIHEQADIWNLKFTRLSELNSLGGPFAGMFWSDEHNFIVVVFKGTTPTDFEDFLVDAMIQRVDARPYVFGEVHEGFYTSLFPETDRITPRGHASSPYITIIKKIREKAARIRERNAQLSPPIHAPVNLWVTGHSLGAALSTLFYSRLLNSPADLGPNCILRDGYLFGTPAIGDADFAAEYAAISNTPFDRQNTLWRIIDDTDIITKLPLGFEDPSVLRFSDKFSVFNYAHVGEGIRFFQDGRPPVSTWSLFKDSRAVVCDETWHSRKDAFPKYEHKLGSPLMWVEKLLPTFFRNHVPIRYFEAMERARVYFDDDDDDNDDNGKKVNVEN